MDMLGTSLDMLGTSLDMLGTSLDMLGTSLDIGTSHVVAAIHARPQILHP